MRVRFGFLIIAFGVVGYACSSDPGELDLGNSGLGDTYGVLMLDTITVAASTVLLDSIPTSGTGSLLVGGYRDDRLGMLHTEGYIQVGLREAWEPSATARFDSLVLVATYSGYYYGDTTATQTLEVCRVSQDFKTYSLPQFWIDENQYSAFYSPNSLYNSSTVEHDAGILGSKTFRPRPGSGDSLVVRLDDNLGREWFQLAQNQSETLSVQSSFLDYFKGISIAITGDQSNCVVGFQTGDLKIKLYYSQYSGNDVFSQTVQEFPFNSGLYNYSKIWSNRGGSTLANLTTDSELSSEITGDESYIQAGTGVVTKIRFPYVRKFIDLEEFLIVNQAQLIIEPVKNTFDNNYPLPDNLTLFETDKSNLPIRQLTADYNSEIGQSATISFDKEFDTSTGYIFNITQYAQSMLSTEGNTEDGLFIMPPFDELNTSVNKAVLSVQSGGTYRVKLKVWVTIKK